MGFVMRWLIYLFSCFQQDDPFSSSDPFGSAFSSSSNKKSDAFDPFGTSGSTPSSKQVSLLSFKQGKLENDKASFC